ncbi:MAG TPA: hypothetical protein VGR91_14200 [Stellaceae bacterium]|nr:hypothetical protein [Stellaceae bacterium]
MRAGRFIKSSSWAPVVAASSTAMQTATAAVSLASTAESCVEAARVPAALYLTSAAASVRRATNRARPPLWASAKAPAAAAPPEPPPERDPATNDGVLSAAVFEAEAAAEPTPRPADEVHLEIDALQYYELLKPIPVVIRTLGERTFEAEVAELNISTTGSSLTGAFLSMKEQIISIFDRYRGKKVLNSEQQRQLAAFEKYVAGPRRNWYAR